MSINLNEEISLYPEKVHCDDDMGNAEDIDAYDVCVTSCYHSKRDLLKAALPIFKELFAEADPKAFYDIYDTNDFLVYIHRLLKDK